MKPELNREYPELDDPKVFARMVDLTLDQMEPIGGHVRRGQHVKATGCVTAAYRIADDVPVALRHGIFRRPGQTFNAIVRFSNSQNTIEKDDVGTARGLALKLLDVAGARAVPDDGDDTQDFLMVDHPVFPFSSPEAYVDTLSKKHIPLVGNLVAAAHMALLEPAEFEIVKAIRGKRVASPLAIRYWSGAPFWLGPAAGDGGHAVKYSVVPRPTAAPVDGKQPDDLPEDYLSEALSVGLRTQDAIFDFRVQLQTDAEAMPVEDVSVEWNEADSVPLVVATLRIHAQPVDSSGELAKRCEQLSFNPWHALAEHRPLGGMNRLRKVVYEASVTKRGGQPG
jgi:hypothetical protein